MTYNNYSKFKKGDIVIINNGILRRYGMVIDSDPEGEVYSVRFYSNLYNYIKHLSSVRNTFNEKDLDRVGLSGKFCYSMITLRYLLQ